MKNKKLHVACSPLTGTIFCGHVWKDGKTWSTDKQDVTMQAMMAVAEHIELESDGDMSSVIASCEKAYKITVEKLT